MRPLDFVSVRSMIIALTLAGILGCTDEDRETSRTTMRSPAERKLSAIQLLDLEDNPFDLWRESPPAITVVLFTRSDCPISNRFAPEVRRLHDLYHPQGVKFFLVYVDPRESAEDIRQHLRDYQYPCQALRDPRHTLVAHCQATITPEAVVFEKDRTIVYQGRINDLYAGLGQPRAEPTTHDLAEAIESAVHGQPVDRPRSKAIGCRIADLSF